MVRPGILFCYIAMNPRIVAALAVLAVLALLAAYYYLEKVDTKIITGNNGAMPCSLYCSSASFGGAALPASWKGAKAVGQVVNGVAQPVTNTPGTPGTTTPSLTTMSCACRRSDSTPYLTASQLYKPWNPSGASCPAAVCATGVGSTAGGGSAILPGSSS